jgi:hypothetical protein
MHAVDDPGHVQCRRHVRCRRRDRGSFIAAGSHHALSGDGHWISFNAGSGTVLVPVGQVVIGSTGF